MCASRQKRKYNFLYLTLKARNGNVVSICDETFNSHTPEFEGDLRKATTLGLCLPHLVALPSPECPKNTLSNDKGEPERKPPSRAPHIQAGWHFPVASPLWVSSIRWENRITFRGWFWGLNEKTPCKSPLKCSVNTNSGCLSPTEQSAEVTATPWCSEDHFSRRNRERWGEEELTLLATQTYSRCKNPQWSLSPLSLSCPVHWVLIMEQRGIMETR